MKLELQSLLALGVLLWSAPAARADEGSGRLAPNSIYAEGFGAGIAYSLNYERLVIDQVAVRVGVSWFPVHAVNGYQSVNSGFGAFPITASYVGLRSHEHALELGGGVTLAYSGAGGIDMLSVYVTGDYPELLGVAFAGYRFHPEGKAGLQMRVGFMGLAGNGFALSHVEPARGFILISSAERKFGAIPWVYWSVGVSF